MDGTELLPEFDQEMASTRKMLERVPDEHLTFKPHEKSSSLLDLAGHVATLPTWVGVTLNTTELDLDEPWDRPSFTSRQDLLEAFDKAVEDARPVLESTTAKDLAVTWTLRSGDNVWLASPRSAVYRSLALNHLIHHRAQLGVYLRLLDVPVPGMYGPSADEK
jgi:uncharacterized damage-inducible protein DinB